MTLRSVDGPSGRSGDARARPPPLRSCGSSPLPTSGGSCPRSEFRRSCSHGATLHARNARAVPRRPHQGRGIRGGPRCRPCAVFRRRRRTRRSHRRVPHRSTRIGRRACVLQRCCSPISSTRRAGGRARRPSLASVARHHDSTVRAEIGRYGGSEVNTTGDGFLAKFDSPTQAVRAGQAIVIAAAETDLAVRVGIHTGECERRGGDLAGLTVHIAARVAGCAGPDEVLVSRTVRDLLAGTELRFADRGETPEGDSGAVATLRSRSVRTRPHERIAVAVAVDLRSHRNVPPGSPPHPLRTSVGHSPAVSRVGTSVRAGYFTRPRPEVRVLYRPQLA